MMYAFESVAMWVLSGLATVVKLWQGHPSFREFGDKDTGRVSIVAGVCSD